MATERDDIPDESADFAEPTIDKTIETRDAPAEVPGPPIPLPPPGIPSGPVSPSPRPSLFPRSTIGAGYEVPDGEPKRTTPYGPASTGPTEPRSGPDAVASPVAPPPNINAAETVDFGANPTVPYPTSRPTAPNRQPAIPVNNPGVPPIPAGPYASPAAGPRPTSPAFSPSAAPAAAPAPAATPYPASTPYPSAAPYPGTSGMPGYASAGSLPQGLSIASMILGIVGALLSFVSFGFLPALAAVITAHMALRRQPHAKPFWLTGLITGYVGLAISLLWFGLFAFPFVIFFVMDANSGY